MRMYFFGIATVLVVLPVLGLAAFGGWALLTRSQDLRRAHEAGFDDGRQAELRRQMAKEEPTETADQIFKEAPDSFVPDRTVKSGIRRPATAEEIREANTR